jgi:hypothetical protein
MSQTRFNVGDVVRWTGIAARSFCDETAVVTDVRPNKAGIELMDEYAVRTDRGRSGIYYAAELENASSTDQRRQKAATR